MTTLAILFLAIVLTGATVVCAAVIKGAIAKNPFKSRKTDHDKARSLLRGTLRRMNQ